MDRSKLRISKACQECRVRKIRCDGGEPCQRCQLRDVSCVYRMKARNRMKKSGSEAGEASEAAAATGSSATTTTSAAAAARDQQQHSRQHHPPRQQQQQQQQRFASLTADSSSPGGRSGSLHNTSVAATHRASPSVFLQLYYGPSSNFSLLNAIYHKIEGTRPGKAGAAAGGGDDDGSATREVEEIGPGLDLFNNRRLYFGDLADGGSGGGGGVSMRGNDCGTWGGGGFDAATMFLDHALAERLLERYLTTFWLVLPIWTRGAFRQRLARFYDASAPLPMDDPDTVIVLLALALGASMLVEESAAQYLFRKAKRAAAALDDMVNVQTVQIALLMSLFSAERARPNSAFLLAGVAVRKAVAAGLHKGVLGGGGSGGSGGGAHGQARDGARQMRITIWSLFFWETWLCFSLGRPSSFPEAEMDVPFPTEEKLLRAVVTLARIMSKSAACIYRQHHDSLLPLWNAANGIRRELRQFAEQQREDFNFGMIDDPNAGELGVCQTIVSTLYHHTLILTFRPFLVLRAKLRQEDAASRPPPPAWLDTACEYCLEAARHSIAFLIRAFENNEMCRAICYHGFFIEGASHVLAFELLQDRSTGPANLPWIQLAIRALQLVLPQRKNGLALPVDISENLERMIQSVYPEFRAAEVVGGDASRGPPMASAAAAAPDGGPSQDSSMASYGGAVNGAAAGHVATLINGVGPRSAPMPGFPTATNVATTNNDDINTASLSLNSLNTLDSLATLSNALPPLLFPFTPFGMDEGSSAQQSPNVVGGASSGSAGPGSHAEAPADLTAADLGWNFDFGTMNMEAFLSIDPNLPTDFGMYR